MSNANRNAQWHYMDASGGGWQQRGPVAFAAVHALFNSGVLSTETVVWTPSSPGVGWKKISELPELLAALRGKDVSRGSGGGGAGGGGTGAAAAAAASDQAILHAFPGEDEGPSDAFSADDGAQFVWDPEKGYVMKGSAPAKAETKGKEKGAGNGKGVDEGESGGADASEAKKKKKKKKKRKRKRGPSTWIYFSGLPRGPPPPGVSFAAYRERLERELVAYFKKKCGIVKLEVLADGTRVPRIRLYTEEVESKGEGKEGEGASDEPKEKLKGDGSLCFLQPASVNLAVTLLDGVAPPFAPENPLAVSRADFTSGTAAGEGKGGGGGGGGSGGDGEEEKRKKAKRPRRVGPGGAGGSAAAERASSVVKLQERQALTWDEGFGTVGFSLLLLLLLLLLPLRTVPRSFAVPGLNWYMSMGRRVPSHKPPRLTERRCAISPHPTVRPSQGLCIVVLRHMFHPRDFRGPGAAEFESDLEADLGEELTKLGEVEKITVYSKHPDGVVVVRFADAFAAEKCLGKMSGRLYGGRRLVAEYWDGATNFDDEVDASVKEEEEAAEKKRLEDFGKVRFWWGW